MSRKSGIFGGIIALLLALIYKSPLYPPMNFYLSFNLFTLGQNEYFFWGVIFDQKEVYYFVSSKPPENFISLTIWAIILIIGLNSIMASTTKAKTVNSIKLYQLNIVLTLMLLFIYGTIVIYLYSTNFGIIFTEVLGLGYYFLCLVLGLNIIALKKVLK